MNTHFLISIYNQWRPDSIWENYYPKEMKHAKLRFCKLESGQKYTKLCFHIPAGKEEPLDYVILYNKEQIVVLAKSEKDYKKLKKHLDRIENNGQSTGGFLCEWFQTFFSC